MSRSNCVTNSTPLCIETFPGAYRILVECSFDTSEMEIRTDIWLLFNDRLSLHTFPKSTTTNACRCKLLEKENHIAEYIFPNALWPQALVECSSSVACHLAFGM